MRCSPSPIMAESSLSRTRVLSEPEVDEPAHRKLRLDDYGNDTNEANNDSAMEDPIASTSQPTKNDRLEKKLKKYRKRKGIRLPEL